MAKLDDDEKGLRTMQTNGGYQDVLRDIENIIGQIEKDSPDLGSGFVSSTYAA